MPIRITGLNSGLDTEAIISALVSSYNYKTQKYEKAQTKLSWKQDAWKTLNTKIYSLYKTAGNMKLSTAYNMKSATVSDSTKVSVTAGSSAVNGSYSVHVASMAKAGYLTGGQLKSGTTTATTLSELENPYNGSGTISLKVGSNGTTKQLNVTGTTKISDVVNWMKESGVNASYDAANRRIYVSAKESGLENDFSLTSDADGAGALTALKLNVITKSEATRYESLVSYSTKTEDEIKNIITAKRELMVENAYLTEKNANLKEDNVFYQSVVDYFEAKEYLDKVKEEGLENSSTNEDYDKLEELAKKTDLTDEEKSKLEELAKAFGMTKTDEDGNEILDENEENIFDEGKLKKFQDNLSVISNASEAVKSAEAYFKGDSSVVSEVNAVAEYFNAKEALNEIKWRKPSENYDLLEKLALIGENDSTTGEYKYDKLTDKYVDAAGNIYTKNADDNSYVDAAGKTVDVTNKTLTAAVDKLNELTASFELSAEELATFRTNLSTISKEDEKEMASKADLAKLAGKSSVSDLSNAIEANKTAITNNETTIKANETTLQDEPIINSEMKITAYMTDDAIAKAATVFKKNADYAAELAGTDGKVDISTNTNTDGLGATRIEGSDSVIYVNKAKYTGTSNTFSINGMTITATGVTVTEREDDNDDEITAADLTDQNAVNVSVNTDVQGLYDKIKDFLSEYNSIINEMTALYNADSAKGYEPLTDEEKDAMSDSEVEKWETKIKDSLLRRDSTLSTLINNMTNAMSRGIEIGTGDDKKKYYLSSFGIKTLGYLNAPKNQHNAYHIDGDEDDVNTAGNADRLMAALAEDPDTVMEFMQKLSDNLYEAIHTNMQSTSLSSVYTVYNDKEMASEYSDYTSLIRKWQERLEQQEEYYYNKFAAMETALSKINSQTSSLSGLFGS